MKLKTTWKKLICGVLALIVMGSCVACKPESDVGATNVPMKYLVQDGKSDYGVVIAENASEAIELAADDLVAFFSEVTGASFSVKRDSEVQYGESEKVISIGKNSLSKKAGLASISAAEVNTDGFIFKNVGEMIFINGYCDRGSLYGTYQFIEKYLGVKFLTSNATYIPKKKDVLIEKDLDVLEKPVFEVRHLYSNTAADCLFATRRGLTPVSNTEESKYGGGFREIWYDWQFHNTMAILKTSPAFAANQSAWLNDDRSMICYTNGLTDAGVVDQTMEVSAVKAVIEELKRRILESSPTQKYFMIGQEDHYAPCNCSRCAESIARNGNRTGMMLVWMNAIAKELEEWAKVTVPNKEWYISCFSYQWSANAPVKTDSTTGKYVPYNNNVIPHKSVYVFYAPIDNCYSHALSDTSCTKNETGRKQLEMWNTLTDRIAIWEYGVNYRHFLWWFPNLSVLKENFRTYYESGIKMVRHQAACSDKTGYQQQLNTYLISKLMWDFEQDVYDIVHEFNEYYYEEAADEMNAFVDLFESHYAMLNMHSDLYENSKDFLLAENYPLEMLQRAILYTEQGMAKIEASNRTPGEKRDFASRFERAAIQARYMVVKNSESYALADDEKEVFIAEFFRMVDSFEMANFGEGRSVINFKAQYGY